MVIIMRTAPDAAGAKHEHAIKTHIKISQPGFGQDGPVLLVVKNHKKANGQEPHHPATNDPQGHRQAGKGAQKRGSQQKGRRQNTPPTSPWTVLGVRLGAAEQRLVIRHKLF
jgi:hypothetical protein